MKTLITTALVLFSMSQAQASFMATSCTDAYGRVSWQEGHLSNKVTLKYINNSGKEVVKTFDRHQLKITLSGEKVLKDETITDCKISPVFSKTRISAFKATLVPERGVNIDMKLGQKIETFVICDNHINSMMHCPNN